MARGPDAGTLVERALHRSAADAGISIDIRDAAATRWASATFAGTRHVIDLVLDDTAAGRAWLGGLSDADLPLRGHLMADCVVAEMRRARHAIMVRVEALTVECA